MPLPEKSPFPTVDVIIEIDGRIVLVERRYPPRGFALPGGFVDPGEPLHRAAAREAKEETSLDVDLYEQFFTYSDPSRDTRRHTISTVFLARARERQVPRAADDAADIGLFTEANLPQLAFDHAQILADYFTYKRTGKRPPPDR